MAKGADQHPDTGNYGLSPEELYSLMMRISPRAPLARDFYLGSAASSGGKGLAAGAGARELFAGSGEAATLVFGHPGGVPPSSLDYVFSPLGGLSVLTSIEELGRFFSDASRCLAPGGLFVFDLENPGAGKGDGSTRVAGSARLPTGIEAVLSESRSLLPGGRTWFCRIGIEELGGAGKVRCKRYCTLALLAPSRKKLLELAKSAGLRAEGVFGGFGMEPLEISSPVQVWVLRKG